jgi:hypothetical protein
MHSAKTKSQMVEIQLLTDPDELQKQRLPLYKQQAKHYLPKPHWQWHLSIRHGHRQPKRMKCSTKCI